MKKIIILFLVFFGLTSFSFAEEETMCIQVIQPATNDETGECKEFSTPCDVPDGWTNVSSCDLEQEIDTQIGEAIDLENCVSYFDGCNNCTVVDGKVGACTRKYCLTQGTPKCLKYKDDTDTQIEDELKKEQLEDIKSLNEDFQVKKFESCEDMKTVVGDYFKEVFKNKNYYTPMYRGMDDVMVDSVDMVMDEDVSFAEEGAMMEKQVTLETSAGAGNSDYSETNIQVKGVDESEIIKTDGEYIYYYNEKDKNIYIFKAYPATDMEVVKKIKIPDNMYNVVFYLSGDKLTILANGYSDSVKGTYLINRNQKTYVIIYDVSNKESLKLSKLYITDGYVSKSRRIGDYLYVISSNGFNYYSYFNKDGVFEADDITSSDMIPKKIDLSRTGDESEQNFKFKGKELPYSLRSGDIVSCNQVEYVFPTEDTIEKYSFNPTYNNISIINIADTSKAVRNKVIMGDVNEIHMSLDNLYITSRLYTNYDFKCPAGRYCIMPYYRQGENTLIHKYNINDTDLSYDDTSIIPGQPLTQYSMDEDSSGNFRIITKKWYPERSTGVYILDDNMKLVGSLEGLGKTEDFKSSRFIGDKLYLVTFKQIDPFFVIDLADETNPKVLGELKIPGYSTYLHPYDENHLIGLGYDTVENEWGGTRNAGLKIDLYDVSDFENPTQAQSLTIGDSGSYTEALNNPRMFMWDDKKKLLLMPADVYKNESPDSYNHTDYFNGLVVVSIDKVNGIKEKARITHLDDIDFEAKRQEDCKKYLDRQAEASECKTLIDGSEYCPPKNNYYVPEYCYADSSIGAYIAQNRWNYNEYMVKRALYIGDYVYSLSGMKIKANDITEAFKSVKTVEIK